MNDLTILFYTANRTTAHFLEAVRRHLYIVAGAGTQIICISQKPLIWPDCWHITVGEIGASAYNVYRQILIGARAAQTKYVACAEDDCLYNAEHFQYRPLTGVFAYNMNRWWLEPTFFRYRDRTGMCTCIAETELMIETLETRFQKFPVPLVTRRDLTGWAEPGRYEKNLGLPPVQLEHFRTEDPVLTFNHKPSLGGLRKTNPTDLQEEKLHPWGYATDLWRKIHG